MKFDVTKIQSRSHPVSIETVSVRHAYHTDIRETSNLIKIWIRARLDFSDMEFLIT